MELKKCNRCDLLKELSFFGKNRSKGDGYTNYCKDCIKQYCRRGEFKVKQIEFEDLNSEIWKNISGYEGYYQVSNYGRIKGLDRFVENRGQQHLLKGCLRKNSENVFGYQRIGLRNGTGKTKMLSVHRLVAQEFIENKKQLPQINHKNGIKGDNYVGNLEWCTASYNVRHSILSGLRRTKLTVDDVIKMRELSSLGNSQYKIAEIFGNICSSYVWDILNGKNGFYLNNYKND